jgi:Lon protease-like protein
MGILQNIPLFPLGTVLFPKQYLPLHIFEERYKLMIGECLRDQSRFGVVLIRAGREAGGPAVPFETGTTARIVDMESLEGGRMNIKTIGERPFHITRITQQLRWIGPSNRCGRLLRRTSTFSPPSPTASASTSSWTSTPKVFPSSWPASSPSICRRNKICWKSPAPASA